MKLHGRTLLVQSARNEMTYELLRLSSKHELTLVELAQTLGIMLSEVHKWMLRAERHPEDETKKADEL